MEGSELRNLLIKKAQRALVSITSSAALTDRTNGLSTNWLSSAFSDLLATLEDFERFLRVFYGRADLSPLDMAALFSTTPAEFVELLIELLLPAAHQNRMDESWAMSLTIPLLNESLHDRRATIVRILYATDRMPSTSVDSGIQFNADRSPGGDLTFGECEISVPPNHRIGHMESPSWFRFEFSPRREKHIMLDKVITLPEREFLARLGDLMNVSDRQVFVFVHGYNVSFENGARRTGQIARDLRFNGVPIFYSWPAHGDLQAYWKDETNVTWTTPHFQRFLRLIVDQSRVERIHVIAHSMGNRAVCDAIRQLSSETIGAERQLHLNHLVLTAPDIDADTFRELSDALKIVADKVTLYASSRDRAIKLSRQLHGHQRAGEPLVLIKGIDTIDVSAVDTDFFSHSVFCDNWPLLSELHALLAGQPAQNRFGLRPIEAPDGSYFIFQI